MAGLDARGDSVVACLTATPTSAGTWIPDRLATRGAHLASRRAPWSGQTESSGRSGRRCAGRAPRLHADAGPSATSAGPTLQSTSPLLPHCRTKVDTPARAHARAPAADGAPTRPQSPSRASIPPRREARCLAARLLTTRPAHSGARRGRTLRPPARETRRTPGGPAARPVPSLPKRAGAARAARSLLPKRARGAPPQMAPRGLHHRARQLPEASVKRLPPCSRVPHRPLRKHGWWVPR
jgi:hypothetical protein